MEAHTHTNKHITQGTPPPERVKSSRRVTLSFPTLSHVDYLNCSTTKLSPLSRTPTIYDVRKISRRSDHCVGLTSTIVSRSSKGTYNDRPFAVYVMTVLPHERTTGLELPSLVAAPSSVVRPATACVDLVRRRESRQILPSLHMSSVYI
jgi:hypothetical protein